MNTRESVCLSGWWKFIPEGSEKESQIYVPSQWTHGACFGYPESWRKIKKAVYRKNIILPVYQKEKIIQIRFDAVMLFSEVFINDLPIGGQAGGFTPFTCVVPDHFWRDNSGKKAVLSVRVRSAAEAVTAEGIIHQISYPDGGEEGPIPGGIWQNVYLESKPRVTVNCLHINFIRQSRKVCLQLEISNFSEENFSGRIDISLFNKKSVTAAAASSASCPPGEHRIFPLEFVLPGSFLLWSNINPALYRLALNLSSGGKIVDEYIFRTGFREVKTDKNKILLNGEPVFMAGISLIRQRVAPYLWRRDYLELYFKTLKSLGFNSLRLHACIAPPLVIEICDELGIMLINQSSIWSGCESGYRLAGEKFIANTKREFREWVKRDFHHPSVLIWDVENEQVRINKANEPWVNELVEYMRPLTGLPVCASGAGVWAKDDFIHHHCEENLHRLMNLHGRDDHRPVIAGEWWGPQKVYVNEMHSPFLAIKDIKSNERIFSELAEFYGHEIKRQRINGAAGTFPFALEIFLFRPLFSRGEKLKAVKENPPDYPALFYAEEFFHHSTYHQVRRLLVNPGWDSKKKKTDMVPVMAAALKKSLSPLLLDFLEENTDFYAGNISRTACIINNSGFALKGELSARLITAGKKPIVKTSSLAVNNGENLKIPLQFKIAGSPAIKTCKIQLSFKTGKTVIRHEQKIHVWPDIKFSSDIVYCLNPENNITNFLASRGITISRKLPGKGGVLILGSSAELDPGTAQKLLESGTCIIILQREKQPGFVPVPFKLKSPGQKIKDSPAGRTSPGLLDQPGSCPILQKKHEFWEKFPKNRIGPFAAGAGTAEGLYLRPSQSGAADTGDFIIHAGGFNRSQTALAEVGSGRGKIYLCQLSLAENLGLDPQADFILSRMLQLARPRKNQVAGINKKTEKILHDRCGLENCAWNSDTRILLAGQEALAGIFSGLKKKDSEIFRFFKCGGKLILSLDKPVAVKGEFAAQKITTESLVAALDDTNCHIFNWTALEYKALLADKKILTLFPAHGWNTLHHLFFHELNNTYGGFFPGEKAGALLIEKKIGKGSFYICGADLFCEHAGSKLLLMSLCGNFFSGTGPARFEEKKIIIKKTIPFTPDGDLGKWTNEEADRNLSAWSRAVPVIIDERGLVRSQKGSKIPGYRNGSAAYMLYDDENLYISFFILSDFFYYTGVEVFHHERSGIEIRIGSAYLLVSRSNDKPFLFSKNLSDPSLIKINITDPDPDTCPDRSLLMIPNLKNPRAVFYELKIPFQALPEGTEIFKTTVLAALAVNACNKNNPEERINFSYPPNYEWNDPMSWCTLVFEKN